MKRTIASYMLLITTACSAAEAHYLKGVSGGFCLPSGSAVADVPWVPDYKQGVPGGFAFAGCWRASGDAGVGCEMPRSVIGGNVQPRSAYRSERWGDLSAGTLYKQVGLSPDAEIRTIANGTMVMVQDQKLWRDWFIWSKAKPLSGGVAPHLEDDDVLVVACHRQDVAATSAADRQQAVICVRSVLGKDYALEYSFVSAEPEPSDVRALDAAVMSTLDNWRCKS